MRFIGIAILAAVFVGLIWATASVAGWWVSVGVWCGSFLLTAVIVLGVFLATSR